MAWRCKVTQVGHPTAGGRWGVTVSGCARHGGAGPRLRRQWRVARFLCLCVFLSCISARGPSAQTFMEFKVPLLTLRYIDVILLFHIDMPINDI